MISKRKIILYFGFAGMLPVMFYVGQSYYTGKLQEFDLSFVLQVLTSAAVAYTVTALVSASVIYSITLLDRFFPWEKGTWKRIFTEFFYTNTVAVLSIVMINSVTFYAGLSDFQYEEHIVQGIIIALVLNMFLTTFYEGIRLFNNWKHTLVESERLEKENMASRFEALKNQVNPHFLFNSLNTLSSLIYSDTEKAETFIDEFANIYRYVLENQERFVVSLGEEIEFINSFIYLLKIRFGDSLVFHMHVNSDNLGHQLPTLSLQLLVENAIKHNTVTKERPLAVSIATDDDYIFVKNNLQQRVQQSKSTGIGLANLKQRYHLLTNIQPEFYIENAHYIAKLPLIPPE